MKYSNKELILYLNGILSSIELLNDAPCSAKDYAFVELNSTSDDLESNLKNYLGTPDWNIKFSKLDEGWKEIVAKESLWAFTEIVTQNHGSPTEVGIEKYEAIVEKYNIKKIQKHILDTIEDALKSLSNFEVYKVEIGAIQSGDNSGYFAHGESNYLFNTAENKMYLLYFRASD